ncbi:MAG: transcriptional regulator NadR [Pseudomonadota bacterium]|jgi:NadR type nicotinamide-nucleotide adenylyltransferase
MTNGFLLGKFLPPHSGHLFMCRTAMGLCDRLSVLVCSLPDDPIPGHIRHGWMQQSLPGAQVLHHDQIVPQEPKDHPDFWPIWQAICKAAHPERIDYVFGSEPYIARLAAELSAEAVLIDPDRLAMPISGTRIRQDPVAAWPFIPGVVRPWYQKRVVLFGAESTGKTTLARQLASDFATVHVPEYGRIHDANRQPGPWTSADFQRIMAGHRAMRAALAPQAGPVLIEDTDPLLTHVWQGYLADHPGTTLPDDTADLYLLLDTDQPWLDDGTRYQANPADRARFQRAALAALHAVGANVVHVSGQHGERLATCRAAITTLLAGPSTIQPDERT